MTILIDGQPQPEGDTSVTEDGIYFNTGTVTITGDEGGFVSDVDYIRIVNEEYYDNPQNYSPTVLLTVQAGPSPVVITVGDQSNAGDEGSIIVGQSALFGNTDGTTAINIEDGAQIISRNNAYYDAGTNTVVGGYRNVRISDGGRGAAISVTGDGSALLAYGTGARITVGASGLGVGTLSIDDGASAGTLGVFVGDGAVGHLSVSDDYNDPDYVNRTELNINDTYGQYGGALSAVAGGLTVGVNGGQGIVSLSYAGAINVSNTDGVTDAPFVNVGRDVGSTGQINVERFGAELNITQNGTAAAGGAFLGIGRDGAATVSVSGGGLSVTGDNALITVAHELNAGDNTRSGQLEIYQGGSVTIDSGSGDGGGLVIGQSANTGAAVTVDGDFSRLSVISDAGAAQSYGAFITVGREGDGSLAVTYGGAVIVDANDDIVPVIQIGYGAVTGSITVDGAGLYDSSSLTLTGNDTSHLASAGLMIVGRNAGSDGSLTVSDGGIVTLSQTNSLISVANEANSTGAITISGSGSSLTAGLITVSVDNDFNFANPGANTATGGAGRIDVRAGGTLTAERLTIGDRGDADLVGTVTTDIELHGDLALNGVADGTLTLTGDLTVEQQGSLSITISSFANGAGDQLIINGDADFGALTGGVDLTVSTSENFAAGDTFVFATVSGALTATTRVVADQNSGQTFTLSAENGQLILTANEAQIGDDGLFEGDETANLFDGGEGDDTMFGFGGDDTLLGGDEDDLLIGGAGADDLNGGDGFDFVSYADASRRVQVDTANIVNGIGDAAGDVFTSIEGIIGTRFNDNLRGGNEDNDIQAGGFSDRLFGRGGDDTLDGGGGADAIFGNSGADEMAGGAGRDRFIYFRVTETGVGEGQRDVITDFDAAAGETMEIRRFDADTTQGFRQAFDFIGADAFSNTAGELRFDQSSGLNTIVQADTNGDGLADFEIELTGLIALTEANFLI